MEAPSSLGQAAKLESVSNGGIADDALNSTFLEFLTDDLVFGSEALDSATLEAVCQVADTQRQPACQGSAAITATQSGPLTAIAPGTKRPLDDGPYSESDEEDDGGKGEKSTGKRMKGGEMSAAATKKACREKARREKLNERFLDLARLVDPGSEPKTDKSTILTDAIKYVQQITVENHQLRQLNKFLEERVSTLERERGQQLYQQSLMMSTMGQGQMMPAGQTMLVGGPAGMMAGPAMAGAAMGHPHMHMPTAMVASTSNPLLNAASMPTASTPPLPSMQSQQQQQQQLAPGGLRPQAPGGLLAQAPGAMMTQLPMAGVAAPGLGPVGAAVATSYNVAGPSAGAGPSKPVMVNAVPGMMPYQGMYWLPPQMMDSTQDSLLRPPAA